MRSSISPPLLAGANCSCSTQLLLVRNVIERNGKLVRNRCGAWEEEARNRLIIPTMQIVEKLRPRFLLLENVPQMANTVIRNDQGEQERILDFVRRVLPGDYEGCAEVLACEDFGIPQRRKRLITIYTRDAAAKAYFWANGGSFITDEMRSPGPTLREAIGHLPPLDGTEEEIRTAHHPQHACQRCGLSSIGG